MLKLSKDVENTHGEINSEYRTGIFKMGFGGYKGILGETGYHYQHRFCEKNI